MPLDLSDEDLLAGGAALERAAAELNPGGWNTHGGVYPSGFCRAAYQISVILSEILGIALAPDPNTTLETLRYQICSFFFTKTLLTCQAI